MEAVTMSRKELDRVGILTNVKEGTMSKREAAAKLSLSIRQVKRLWSTYKQSNYDPASLVHLLRGLPSNHRIDETVMNRAIGLVKTEYSDFGPTFAAEKLNEVHGISIGHDTLRRAMIAAGIWTVGGPHQPAVHPWRERRAVRGELVQADGSPHAWFEDRAPKFTLIQFIDDATGEVLALELAKSESTHALMTTTWHLLNDHGRPRAVYVDRGGVFKVNIHNENDEKITQYERALTELGIELIHARSPQAKGRVERGFQTHQDRLVKELRLAGISTMTAANAFIRDVYLPKHNAKFARLARQAGDVHRSVDGYDLDAILANREERIVTNDLTIRYKTRWLQLTPKQRTIVRPKHVVTVSEHLDGRLTIWHGRTNLDFTELPKQPTRQLVPDLRQSIPRVPYKPAKNHPWRNYYQPVSVLLSTTR